MKRNLITLTLLIFICCQFLSAQTAPVSPQSSGRFHLGERLTYNISFSNFPTAAYAETYVISNGKYGTQDAVYLQGKIRTTEIVSAAFFTLDETRQTLVSPVTGLPLYSKRIFDENGNPREKAFDFKGAAAGYDWLSAIFQLRFSSQTTGSLTIQEGDEVFQASYTQAGSVHVKTAAGEFDTVIVDIQNPTFPGLKIYFSTDEQRVPVVMTYKHPKGMFRAELAGIQDLSPLPVVASTPRPQTTPVAVPTPKPRPTPAPYANNQPLSADLPFILGETLSYRLTRPNNPTQIGTMVVQAKERKQFNGRDSVLLAATVQQITETNSFFSPGDSVKSYVDPESLLPNRTEILFKGPLSQFNQTLAFDQISGRVADSRAALIDIPVGTHDILSLAYAIRSFNLKDSKPNNGPGMDTRVAVFTVDGPVILTILPQPEETIEYLGEKVSTQVVFTNIGQTTVKLWLSKEMGRLPLRLSVTSPTFAFVADLTGVTQNPPAADGTAATQNTPAGIPTGIPGFPGVTPSQINTINANPTVDSNIKKP